VARPRRKRQGGRAVLLWALAFYAAAQPAVRYLMDGQLPPPWVQTWQEKWQQLGQLAAREPDRPLLVMLGSSRTDRALQAGRLNGLPGPDGKPYLAYNLGLPGAGPLRVGLTLREMLDVGIRPRLLLVEYLPPFLNEPRRDVSSEESWPMSPWLSPRELFRLCPYYSYPGRIVGDWLEVRLATPYAFRSEIQKLLCRVFGQDKPPLIPPPHDPWGYEIPEPLTDALRAREIGTTVRMYFRGLRRFRLGRGQTQALRDVLDLCRREEIPVVLVLMPESPAFRTLYAPEGLAAALRLLEELRETYGAGLIDATNWVADKDFIDGHHVLAGGAAVFTTRLRRELEHLLAQAGEAGRPGAGP
jgi:hypothetical protein